MNLKYYNLIVPKSQDDKTFLEIKKEKVMNFKSKTFHTIQFQNSNPYDLKTYVYNRLLRNEKMTVCLIIKFQKSGVY